MPVGWTTIGVAAVTGVVTLGASLASGTPDLLWGHRAHCLRQREELGFERDAKEREAIYKLFDLLPGLETACNQTRRLREEKTLTAGEVPSASAERPHLTFARNRRCRVPRPLGGATTQREVVPCARARAMVRYNRRIGSATPPRIRTSAGLLLRVAI
jgi:hypothetical protein